MTIFQALADLEHENRAAALCTIVRSNGSTPRHSGSKMLVYPDGSITGTIGGGTMEGRVIEEARQAILDGRSRLLSYKYNDPARGDVGVCGGQIEVYVEPLTPKPTLVVIGAGHVGKAVVWLAKWLGFYVVVNDDRPEFCNSEAVPGGDAYILCTMEDLPQHIELNHWTYLVLTTRGMNVDVVGLPVLLDSPVPYLGVIGSHRRWALTRKDLLEKGLPPEKLDRVRAPIGLELNAETPEEIALSIMAEVVMIRQGGDGAAMSLRKSAAAHDPA